MYSYDFWKLYTAGIPEEIISEKKKEIISEIYSASLNVCKDVWFPWNQDQKTQERRMEVN